MSKIDQVPCLRYVVDLPCLRPKDTMSMGKITKFMDLNLLLMTLQARLTLSEGYPWLKDLLYSLQLRTENPILTGSSV